MSFTLLIDQDPRHYAERLIKGEIPIEDAIQTVFQFQLRHHTFYRRFSEQLFPELTANALKDSIPFPIDQLPMIPIRAFKELDVLLDREYLHSKGIDASKGWVFKSSGTTLMIRSTHLVPVPEIYEKSVRKGFSLAYPKDSSTLQKSLNTSVEERSNAGFDLPIISYLPGYRDNEYSSLIRMMEILTDSSNSPDSPILSNPDELLKVIHDLREPVLLFGAAFGLADVLDQFADHLPLALPKGSKVIETGGMKTHRREIPKPELIQRLSSGFGIPQQDIHSEYGMCEMLSQSYSKGDEWFTPSPWLIFQIRHPDNPLQALPPGKRGKLGYIDLCNLFSCPFVLTDDEAEINEHGQIRLFGRWPGEEARGCNFLIDRD